LETFRASQRFLVLIRKEFVSLSKERTLPFTIVIQLLTVLLSVSLASSFAFSAGGGELETGSMRVVNGRVLSFESDTNSFLIRTRNLCEALNVSNCYTPKRLIMRRIM